MGDGEGKPAEQIESPVAKALELKTEEKPAEAVKPPQPNEPDEQDDGHSALKDWVELLVRAGIWALIIYIFLFQISIVEGESMMPTFRNGDRLVIDKLTYRFGSVHRGDVVVFEAVDVDKRPRRPKDYIKRVIGLPGETVEIYDGAVWVNGAKVEDSFGPTFTDAFRDPKQKYQFVVPPHQYFVMGDNRDYSKDSRSDPVPGHFGRQSLGFVHGRQIRGIVRLRFLPWRDWTWFSRQ